MNTAAKYRSDCPSSFQVAIVGGGVSGLSSAYYLLREAGKHGIEIVVTIFERKAELGGAIKTILHEGSVLEMGPECFVSTKPAVVDLAKDLKIDSRILAQSQRQTFIAGSSDLCEIPEGLLSMSPKIAPFLSSRLISASAKARMAIEPFVSRRADSDDESVAKFLERRFGGEFVERVAEPLIGGLYGTDPAFLSARSTMPHLVGLENVHGSVVIGMLKDRLRQKIEHDREQTIARSNAGRMSTFDMGMGVLVEELRAFLQPRVEIVNTDVVSVYPEGGQNKWRVLSRDVSHRLFDSVFIAVPAPDAARLLPLADEKLSSLLSRIKYSSPTVVSLIYDGAAFGGSLKGSGFLVPLRHRRSVRACTFSSNKFRRGGCDKKIVLRVSCNASSDYMPEDETIRAVIGDLKKYLRLQGEPLFSLLTRHEAAIPQFAPGHEDLLGEIEKRKGAAEGLALVGNAYGGMGISDCVMRAKKESERIAAGLVRAGDGCLKN